MPDIESPIEISAIWLVEKPVMMIISLPTYDRCEINGLLVEANICKLHCLNVDSRVEVITSG